MQKTRAFALLVSVPETNLIYGLEAIAAQLDADDLPPDHSPKVVFGSMAFEVFAEVEELRNGKTIEVFIYASQSKAEQPLKPEGPGSHACLAKSASALKGARKSADGTPRAVAIG